LADEAAVGDDLCADSAIDSHVSDPGSTRAVAIGTLHSQ
jgi:hypothetical protein